MILVGLMAAAIWGAGAAMGTPRQARLTMLGLLLVAVLAIHVLLPDGHPLREATGGDGRLWLLLVGLAGLAWMYSRVLSRVRAAAVAAQAPAEPAVRLPGPLSDDEVSRYARHVTLREIGGTYGPSAGF